MALFRRAARSDIGDQGSGLAGAAKIVDVRDGGTRRDVGPVMNLHLLVSLPGQAPFPVSVPELVSPSVVARAKRGARVPVSVDPATQAVAIDWAAVPA